MQFPHPLQTKPKRSIAPPKAAGAQAARHIMPLDGNRIDAALGGGLSMGVLHEMTAHGIDVEFMASAAGFLATILARMPTHKPIFWVCVVADLYPPGLIEFGLNPSQLIQLHVHSDLEALAVSETLLRAGAAAAVVAEIGQVGTLAGRRLQLACLRGGTTCFVLRRFPHGARAARSLTAAVTRWCLHPSPSTPRFNAPGPACWRVELLHARGGLPGVWVVQREDSPNATHPFRLAAVLANTAAHSQQLLAG